MKRQIDLVEDFGHGLLADGESVDSDVSHIETELAAVRTRYHDLENSIEDTLEFLEKATSSVNRFVEDLKNTENFVDELEDELDNMGPQGKDLETLANQVAEMERFVGNIDVTAREVSHSSLCYKIMDVKTKSLLRIFDCISVQKTRLDDAFYIFALGFTGPRR